MTCYSPHALPEGSVNLCECRRCVANRIYNQRAAIREYAKAGMEPDCYPAVAPVSFTDYNCEEREAQKRNEQRQEALELGFIMGAGSALAFSVVVLAVTLKWIGVW